MVYNSFISEKLYFNFNFYNNYIKDLHQRDIFLPEEEFKIIRLIDEVLKYNFKKEEIEYFLENYKNIEYFENNIYKYVYVMEKLLYVDIESFIYHLFYNYFSKKLLLEYVGYFSVIQKNINKIIIENTDSYSIDTYIYIIRFIDIITLNVELNININSIDIQKERDIKLLYDIIWVSDKLENVFITIKHNCYDKIHETKNKCNTCNTHIGTLFIHKCVNVKAKNFNIIFGN
jgi:hypothetical protein